MNTIKKNFPLLIAVLLVSVPSMAQRKKAPKWVEYDQRESMFPEDKYVVGFASEAYTSFGVPDELEDRLQSDARTELVESIKVNIRSMSTTQMMTQNEQAHSSFRRTSVSLSNIELQGLKTETYFDKKKRQGFAFSYAEKAEISKLYRNKIVSKKARVEQNLNNASTYLQQNDNQSALKSYYSCMPLFREIEEAQTLIMTFEGVSTDAAHLYFKEVNDLKLKANKGVKSLQAAKDLSIDDAAFLIAMGLKYQADSIKREIRLNNFTFQDTKMASIFSKRFTRSLESKLAANDLRVTIHKPSMIDNVDESEYYNMVGTYWEEGDKIKIIANIRDMLTRKTVASSEATIDKSYFTNNNISYKPANYDNAIKTLVQFNNEKKPNGGLIVDLSTNKGNDGLIFTEGETMKVFVRVNKACYIRLIYHLADGQKVSLLDNYHISNANANKVIELPEEFECTDPFGVETLQLNAQTEEFTPLVTKEEYGYDFIVEDLKEVLFKTRGFKPKKRLDAKTEKRMIITTMRK